jgi:anaerobic ribonucleoside-triphosphate reductase activating protein
VTEITWILDQTSGDLLVEGLGPTEASTLLGDLLPRAREVGCARPMNVLPPASDSDAVIDGPAVRVAGYYHNSLIEGPGRRSCVLMSGCDLGCRGCWVPHLHPADSGRLVGVERLAEALLDPSFARDGVSLLGGEPFFQPDALWSLVQALRARGCSHILVYSGYTYGRLRAMAQTQPSIGAVLADVDMLIDGPFVDRLAHTAESWTGSGNQRVIDLVATRWSGTTRLWTDAFAADGDERQSPATSSRRNDDDRHPPIEGAGCEGWPDDCPDVAPAVVVFEWRDWRSPIWRTLRLCARCEQAFAPGVLSGVCRIRNRRSLT